METATIWRIATRISKGLATSESLTCTEWGVDRSGGGGGGGGWRGAGGSTSSQRCWVRSRSNLPGRTKTKSPSLVESFGALHLEIVTFTFVNSSYVVWVASST